MTLRRRALPVAALVVALGSSAAGMAAAAETGKGAVPKSGPAAGKTVVVVHDKGGKDKGDKGGKGGDKGSIDWAAAAAKLGVTEDQLQNALRDTKLWIGQSGADPTPDLIVQHIADLLHKPAATVKEVLVQTGILGFGDKGGDKNPGAPKPAAK